MGNPARPKARYSLSINAFTNSEVIGPGARESETVSR